MLIRAFIIGLILAGLTGAVVYFGFGERFETQSPAPRVDAAHIEQNVKAAENVKDKTSDEISALADKKPMRPKNVIGVTPDAMKPAKQADAEGMETDTSKSSKKTLNRLLSKDKMSDEGTDAAKTYGSGDATSANMDADKKVKTRMKPRATGSFVVSDTPRDMTKDKTPISKNTASKNMASKNTAQMMVSDTLKTDLKQARRITDKTARDKIYLEIFDKAVKDNHMDIARRIAGKFSTPELREQASVKLSEAGR